MLTSEDIKNISFRRASFGGYKAEDVDTFIDDIQISYEEMLRERQNFILRIQKLEKIISEFHKEENSIKKVLLNAQGVAEKTLSDVQAKTDKMITDAKKEVSLQTEIAGKLKEESNKLKQKLENVYKEHMSIIEKIPVLGGSAYEDLESSASQDLEKKNENRVSGGILADALSKNNCKSEKFMDLKFGENYSYRDNSKPTGLYGGLFKK